MTTKQNRGRRQSGDRPLGTKLPVPLRFYERTGMPVGFNTFMLSAKIEEVKRSEHLFFRSPLVRL